MIGITQWNQTPYVPYTEPAIKRELFITQILPQADGFTVNFQDVDEEPHRLRYRRRGCEEWLESESFCVEGLCEDTDYEVAVVRKNGESTSIRLVHTFQPKGAIVNYLHPEDTTYCFSGRFLCSPSLCLLPSGKLLAGMDLFGHKTSQNLTLLFTSEDKGQTWQYLTDLQPCFWGKPFVHRGRLYMLGMSCEYGDLLIGVSDDEGATWSPPVRLFSGTNAQERGWHKAPMPIIEHENMLYTAIDYGSWRYGGHASCIASCASDTDLLDPKNWHMTTPLSFDAQWSGLPEGKMDGLLEGNAVVADDGSIQNILRLQQQQANPSYGTAVALRMINRDDPLEFESAFCFPLGASSKFVIQKMKNTYVAIGNEPHMLEAPGARNLLSVAVSNNLRDWEIVERVVDGRDYDYRKVAFQYPDMALVGADLIILSRTSWGGASTFHDSNMITCHCIENFEKHIT